MSMFMSYDQQKVVSRSRLAIAHVKVILCLMLLQLQKLILVPPLFCFVCRFIVTGPTFVKWAEFGLFLAH